MYFKIITDGQIIDACDGLTFVKWQEKNQLFLHCEENDADGIVSSDGENIYLFEDTGDINDLQHVKIVEITKEDFEELRAELIDNGAIDADDADEEESGRGEIKKAEWLQRLEELEEQNGMLLECLLEMSEVVYGE